MWPTLSDFSAMPTAIHLRRVRLIVQAHDQLPFMRLYIKCLQTDACALLGYRYGSKSLGHHVKCHIVVDSMTRCDVNNIILFVSQYTPPGQINVLQRAAHPAGQDGNK